MTDLLALQKYFILQHLGEGDEAADFTMGNGNDTVFLSKTVGPEGHVTAFDIQERALVQTRELLVKSGCAENYTLVHDSHDRAPEYITSKIKAGMFNLGYMPGGDHSLTTKRKTTLPAIKGAIELLAGNGILTVAVYPGHEEGKLEGEEIEKYFETLSRFSYGIGKFKFVNSPVSPYFYIVETK